MFFICILTAIIAYALQVTLMVSYYRRLDQMSAVAYRGLSLALSMSPVLLFVPKTNFFSLEQALPALLLASVLATFGNWANASAFRYLSVGIAEALCMVASTTTSAVAGYFVLGDTLSLYQMMLILALLSCVTLLGIAHPHAENGKGRFWTGAFYCMLFGLLLGGAFVGVADASRKANPLLIGYLWESTIGVMAFAAASSRTVWGRTGIVKVSRRDFFTILLYSWPTALGVSGGVKMY